MLPAPQISDSELEEVCAFTVLVVHIYMYMYVRFLFTLITHCKMVVFCPKCMDYSIVHSFDQELLLTHNSSLERAMELKLIPFCSS